MSDKLVRRISKAILQACGQFNTTLTKEEVLDIFVKSRNTRNPASFAYVCAKNLIISKYRHDQAIEKQAVEETVKLVNKRKQAKAFASACEELQTLIDNASSVDARRLQAAMFRMKGATIREACESLDVTRDNYYQLTKRGRDIIFKSGSDNLVNHLTKGVKRK